MPDIPNPLGARHLRHLASTWPGHQALLARMRRQRRRNPVLKLLYLTLTGAAAAAALLGLMDRDWLQSIVIVILWGLAMYGLQLGYRVGWVDRNFEHLDNPAGPTP